MSLGELLSAVRLALEKAFPLPVWVAADVADIRVNGSSGHCYLELVEKGEGAVARDLGDDAEVVYVGTAPLDGQLDRLFDVCLLSWLGNDVRFYFDPVNGSLALMETFASSLDFPCEVRFKNQHGATSFEVRYGKILFGAFEPEEMTLPVFPSPSESRPGEEGQYPEQIGRERNDNMPLEKVVKIYGASGVSAGRAGLHGYQSGIIVSPDGDVLTTMSATLQADPITVVLSSGRKYEARLVQADPALEIALLRIPASGLPFFSLDTNGSVQIGDPVLALSNPFNIAQGNEPVSVQRGVLAAQTVLRARRGVFETPYQGQVYVTDITTNNPGAAGGALIEERSGELIGLIGKELRNSKNNTWLNFAIPVFVFREPVRRMMREASPEKAALHLIDAEVVKPEQELIPEDTIRIFQDWGVLLVPSVGRRTPPFVDSVKAGSVAEKAGLKQDDLIVMIDGQLTASLAAVEELLHRTQAGQEIIVTVERNMTLQDIKLRRIP